MKIKIKLLVKKDCYIFYTIEDFIFEGTQSEWDQVSKDLGIK